MDNIALRAVSRYLTLKGLSPKEVHEDMVTTLGEAAPSDSMVERWVTEFKRARENQEEDPHPAKKVIITSQAIAKKRTKTAGPSVYL